MPKRKRRGIPWGPRNPLWRYLHSKRKSKVNKSPTVHISTVKPMARRRRYRFRPFRRHKIGFPSVASIAAIAGPQVINNSGMLGTYPALANAIAGNYNDAMWNFAANEVMAFTGFDVGKGTWNIQPPLITYGMPIAVKLIRKYLLKGGVRAGPVRLI